MATTIERTTLLDCRPDEAWERVTTSPLLQHIASPLIKFVPLKGQPFPHDWKPGEYRAWMFLLGFIPLGWQAIVISKPEPEGGKRFIRDNGYSPLITRWDHWIEISPADGGLRTRYTDRVTIDAGFLTPIVAMFARVFYAHRQRRWRALASSDFVQLKS